MLFKDILRFQKIDSCLLVLTRQQTITSQKGGGQLTIQI